MSSHEVKARSNSLEAGKNLFYGDTTMVDEFKSKLLKNMICDYKLTDPEYTNKMNMEVGRNILDLSEFIMGTMLRKEILKMGKM